MMLLMSDNCIKGRQITENFVSKGRFNDKII